MVRVMVRVRVKIMVRVRVRVRVGKILRVNMVFRTGRKKNGTGRY